MHTPCLAKGTSPLAAHGAANRDTTNNSSWRTTYFWPGCEAVGPPNLVGAQAAKQDIQGAGTAPLQQLDQCSTDGTCHKLKE